MATCINHPHIEETRPCTKCGRPFCDQCLAELMGQRLCADCKAEAVQGAFVQPRQHPLAVVALVVPIVGYAACCVLVPITSPVGLYLGWKVLREVREQGQYSGGSAALAAIVVSAGTLGVFLLAVVATFFFQVGNR